MNKLTDTVFLELIQEAFRRSSIVRTTDSQKIELAIWRGEEVPDHLLPGRIIMQLNGDARSHLKHLKSEDLKRYRLGNTIYESRRLVSGSTLDLSTLNLK